MRDILEQHLAAAEAEGRSLTDAEASLIESLSASKAPEVSPEPAYVPARLSAADDDARQRQETLSRVLTAVQERQPLITAATVHYGTSRPAGVPSMPNGRLVDLLKSRGAHNLGEQARTFQVPRIAAGGAAAVWTPGSDKAEVPTELASVTSDVVAAWTAVTSTGFMDVAGLALILEGMLAREVVKKENTVIAASIITQADSQTDSTDYQGVVGDAVTDAMLGGGTNLVLMLGANVAAGCLGSAVVGPFGRDGDYGGTIMGHPFVVVSGIDADTAVAVDPRALAVAASPMMTLIDPYSGSVQNSVVIRQETSVAVVTSDVEAIGLAKKLPA